MREVGTSSQEGSRESESLQRAIRDTAHLHHLHISVVSEPVLQLDLNPITKTHYATLNQNTPTRSHHYSASRDSRTALLEREEAPKERPIEAALI